MFSTFYPTTGRAALTYSAYEMTHAMMMPIRNFARSVDHVASHPANPFSKLPLNAAVRASWRVIDELTQRYAKPEFGIDSVDIDGVNVPITEEVVIREPFCNVVRFTKSGPAARPGPKVLIVAPLSGHFATLLRGTVKAMIPEHDVYITDWADARAVPYMKGTFDLHDYVDYLVDFFRRLGPDLHVLAVCQPSVAALAATAIMAEENELCQPRSLTLMAGPVDTASNPTAVNDYAMDHSMDWFKSNVITIVPFPNAGAMRPVYPGFLQLAGFMGMNADSHMQAYSNYFDKLVEGASDDVAAHRRFYDEYLSVLDLTAEFFLQTVDLIFHQRVMAERKFMHRGQSVDCTSIRNTVLFTVEGERDDICGLGQTEAAHDLCSSLTNEQRHHYVQEGVGHYGVFNGRRWRETIQPKIADVIKSAER